MKRLRLHVAVEKLWVSGRFYSELDQPAVFEPGSPKWMIEEPRENLRSVSGSAQTGVQHLGIQVENRSDLEQVYARLKRAHGQILD